MKNNTVTLFRLDWSLGYSYEKREEWFLNRTEGMSYLTKKDGKKAAEEAFHLTNAPDECLTAKQKTLLRSLDFKGPSLSVGDIVKVTDVVKKKESVYYMCKSFGWEKFSGDVISLLKHLN